MAQPERVSRQFETLTDWMRYQVSGITTWLGNRLYQWGVHPDVLTFLGLLVVAASSLLIAQGEFFLAAVVFISGTPLDALDGAVARAMQRKDRFGAFWDSTLDRYADSFIYMGLAYYYTDRGGGELEVALCGVVMLGTLMVSYTRARAEGLGLSCKVGLFTRMERTFVILGMLLTGWIMLGLWILAIGTHFTAFQRVRHVYRLLKAEQGDTPS